MREESYIDVETVEHNGMTYTISICNPKADWGNSKGKFTCRTPLVVSTSYYNTLEEAKRAINKKIDEWVDSNPTTIGQFVDLLEDCMIWTGYEDCELDREAAARVLRKFKNSEMKAEARSRGIDIDGGSGLAPLRAIASSSAFVLDEDDIDLDL